jgi:hypothetical protein
MAPESNKAFTPSQFTASLDPTGSMVFSRNESRSAMAEPAA